MQGVLQAEAMAAQQAEATLVAEVSELERTKVELTQLQSLMAEQAKKLRAEKKQLRWQRPRHQQQRWRLSMPVNRLRPCALS